MTTEKSLWRRVDDKLKYLAPVFMLLLFIYLYSSLVSPILPKRVKNVLEITIIAYFTLELVFKYFAAETFSKFIHEYWLDIILLIPFLKGLRLIGAVGKALKLLKVFKYVPYVQKLAKVPALVEKTKYLLLKYVVPGVSPENPADKGDESDVNE